MSTIINKISFTVDGVFVYIPLGVDIEITPERKESILNQISKQLGSETPSQNKTGFGLTKQSEASTVSIDEERVINDDNMEDWKLGVTSTLTGLSYRITKLEEQLKQSEAPTEKGMGDD